jgi:hypothetical protein
MDVIRTASEVRSVEQAESYLTHQLENRNNQQLVNRLPADIRRYLTPTGVNQQNSDGSNWFFEITASEKNRTSLILHEYPAETAQAAGATK